MLVAIDGPAGAGKSTVARAVADALGFTYLDSGAMYRCVALAQLRGAPDPLKCAVDLTEGRVTLDGKDVTARLRTAEASQRASEVAADPRVRRSLVEQQRRIVGTGDWVAEGRDIGTVVAPHAEVKIFLNADPRERAQRRADQLGADVGQVLREQALRDERDSSRNDSPLVAAEDAVELDTTDLGIEDVVRRIVALASGARAS